MCSLRASAQFINIIIFISYYEIIVVNYFIKKLFGGATL